MGKLISSTELNVWFFIRKTKLLKNGEASVAMRITYNKQYVEIMIKRTVSPALWDQKKECSRGKDRAAEELNRYIETKRTKIFSIQRELETEGIEITTQAICDHYYGRGKKTLIDIYTEHNNQVRAQIGNGYAECTADKFDTSLAHLRAYITATYKTNDVFLTQVDSDFVRGFDLYLRTKGKCANNTAVKHLKNLKKIILQARASGLINKDPFFGIKFKVEDTDIDFLTMDELKMLLEKQFAIPRLEQIRDVFVFCCFTGLAFIDVQTLRPEHLVPDNSGAIWIRKRRHKTGVMCNIPLLNVPKLMLEKYKEDPDCIEANQMLPVPSNQKMNAYLKEIATLCGIHKEITTHVARHTCATSVMLANKVTLENLAKILGHKNTKMTQRYARVLDSSIMRDMGNVEAAFAI